MFYCRLSCCLPGENSSLFTLQKQDVVLAVENSGEVEDRGVDAFVVGEMLVVSVVVPVVGDVEDVKMDLVGVGDAVLPDVEVTVTVYVDVIVVERVLGVIDVVDFVLVEVDSLKVTVLDE